jgi:hypothetical protein
MAMKEITVTLDKTRRLRLDYSGLSRADQEIRQANPTGAGLVKSMLAIVEGDFNFEALRIVYYHALRGADRDITPPKAARVLDDALERDDVGFAELSMHVLRLLQTMGVINFEIDEAETEGEADAAEYPTASGAPAET